MIAFLSSFATQFKPTLVEKARQLFDSKSVKSPKENDHVWQADVITEEKTYKVSLRVEDNDKVTDVFCTCGPNLCKHVIATMFTLQKKLKIKSEEFKPESLEIASTPVYTFGNRINDLIHATRRDGSKNGELEKLGTSVSLRNPDYFKLRAVVRDQLTEYPYSYIFTGAKKLLGAAILAWEDENYPPVFLVGRVILTELCSHFNKNSSSGEECRAAAAALLEELYNSQNTSKELKNEIFDWVIAAWSDNLYDEAQQYLIPVITMTLQNKAQQEKALKKLEGLTLNYDAYVAFAQAKIRLLGLLGKSEDAKMVRYENLSLYREELIEEAFARKDYEEVKKLAREGTKENSPEKWWEWIGKIAEIENDVSAMRDVNTYVFFNFGFDMQFYLDVRSTYAPGEWAEIYPSWAEKFEQIRSISESEIYALANIYLVEGLLDKVALILDRFPRYNMATQLQPVLEEQYPELLKKILWKCLVDMASTSFTHERAAILHKELKHCNRTPWGKKFVIELKSYLFELHPTWKVFRAELSKPL